MHSCCLSLDCISSLHRHRKGNTHNALPTGQSSRSQRFCKCARRKTHMRNPHEWNPCRIPPTRTQRDVELFLLSHKTAPPVIQPCRNYVFEKDHGNPHILVCWFLTSLLVFRVFLCRRFCLTETLIYCRYTGRRVGSPRAKATPPGPDPWRTASAAALIYIYIYIYIYICIHTHIYVCVYIHIYIYI